MTILVACLKIICLGAEVFLEEVALITEVDAAAEEIDATPMEGFAPDAVDEILGLKELGLHSTVALTLGFRDATNDYLVNAKKVRRTNDKLVIKK
jgi:nitroreductase